MEATNGFTFSNSSFLLAINWYKFSGRYCSIFAGPHLILEDFNAVLGSHKKLVGLLPRRASCEDFQAMVDTCDLFLIDTKGSLFTWTNGRGASTHI